MNHRTVYLVDSEAGFALNLETSLKAHDFAVHFFTSVENFLSWVAKHSCDKNSVLVANVSAKHRQELLAAFVSRNPAIPILFSIRRPSIAIAVDLMCQGAKYVLHRPYTASQLLKVIESVTLLAVDTQTNSQESAGATKAQQVPNEAAGIPARLASLSRRQRQILSHVFEGRINKVIAHKLGISIKTVELHRSRMMGKMQAHSAVELIRMTTPYSEQLLESNQQ